MKIKTFSVMDIKNFLCGKLTKTKEFNRMEYTESLIESTSRRRKMKLIRRLSEKEKRNEKVFIAWMQILVRDENERRKMMSSTTRLERMKSD